MLKAYLHPKKTPNDRHCYAHDVVFDGEIEAELVTNDLGVSPPHRADRSPRQARSALKGLFLGHLNSNRIPHSSPVLVPISRKQRVGNLVHPLSQSEEQRVAHPFFQPVRQVISRQSIRPNICDQGYRPNT